MVKSISQKYFWPVLVTLLLVIYQLVRIVVFVNVYGGIEHDGGWMLSISRSLAEQGTYTTMVSTINDPSLTGGINVDQKFDIQTPDGRIWFFTGNGIGPASIVPDALILKIFGTGFWALRAGPLIFYSLFLLLAAYILYRLAGLGAVVLFHAFLFFYPHLSIFLSYEAMGEVPGMFYVLWAYLAFAAALKASTAPNKRRWLRFWGAGGVAGLAIITKLITLWSLGGIFIWAGLLWLFSLGRDDALAANRSFARLRLGELVAWGGGTLLPLALWELVHLVILTRLAGFEQYLRHAQQRLRFILDDGSGLGLQIHSGPEFFWDKFFLLSEVTHPQRWIVAVIFSMILLGGLGLLWQWRGQFYKQNLLAPLWLGWLANTAWFAGLAKTGWPRHFWFGLVLAIMLVCVISVNLLKTGGLGDGAMRRIGLCHSPSVTTHSLFAIRHASLVAGVFLLCLIIWGFASQPHVWGFFLPDELVPYWQQKQINNKYGASLPWIIIPRAAQDEVISFIKQMPPEAHIFYPAQHKAAEIPAQVGRVLYPLNRRPLMGAHPQDVALISPTLIAPWMEPGRREALLNLARDECPQPLVANDYYMICPFPAE